MAEDVVMLVVVVLVVGPTETQTRMEIRTETGKYLLVKVHQTRLMLENLMKGVVAMVDLVVAGEVVSAMEKQEKGTVIVLIGHLIAAVELDKGTYNFVSFGFVPILLFLFVAWLAR